MTTHRHPMPERDAASGQSTTEFLVLALVLVPLFLSLPLLGKYLDLTHATEQAARYVAFETAIQGPARPTPGAGTLASEVRQRFFSLPQAPILSRSGEPMPWQLRRGDGDQRQQWEGVPLQRSLVNAPDMLLRLACAGVGITAVGDHFARPHLASGALRRVLPDWCLAPAPCWAVFPERRLMPLRTRLFLEAMAAVLAGCQLPAGDAPAVS